jgi:hypothetical protein
VFTYLTSSGRLFGPLAFNSRSPGLNINGRRSAGHCRGTSVEDG